MRLPEAVISRHNGWDLFFKYKYLFYQIMAENLRYYALGAYTGLLALFVSLDKIVLDATTAVAALAPIAAVITVDVIKHRND